MIASTPLLASRYALAEYICEQPGFSRKQLSAKLGYKIIQDHLDILRKSGQVEYNRETRGYHCSGKNCKRLLGGAHS